MGAITDRLFGKRAVRTPVFGEITEQDRITRRLFSGEPQIQREFTPTPEISTITGDPIQKFTPTGKPSASLLTETLAGTVDDPQTKLKVFADARGIPVEKYGTTKDGEIFFEDKGKFFLESKRTPGGRIKQLLGSQLARLPETILGVIGATRGPAGAAFGAGVGEAIRKGVGRLVGERATKGEIAKDIAVSAGLGTIGVKAGRAGIGVLDITKGRQGARLIKAAGRDIKGFDIGDTKAIEALAQSKGITLFTPQSTGSPQLIARFNLLGDLPVTADKIGRGRMVQFEQIDQAINDWLGSISPRQVTPGGAGARAVEAAQETLTAAQQLRRNRAKPFYDKAFEEAPAVDIKPVIDIIDGKLQTAKGKIRKDLIQAKETLQNPDLPKPADTETVVQSFDGEVFSGATHEEARKKAQDAGVFTAVDRFRMPDGQIVHRLDVGIGGEFDTTLQGLHDANLEFGDIIESARQTGLGNTSKRNIKQIKVALLEQMDKASPDYKKARGIFAEESINVEGFKGTQIEKLSKLEGDKVENAARIIFAPTRESSAEIVAITKKAIIEHGGVDAWDDLIKTHIGTVFDEIASSNTTNVGGMLRKKLFVNRKQRRILEVAWKDTHPAALQNFDDLMTIFERTAKTAGRESTTATRQVSLGELEREAKGLGGRLIETATRPLLTRSRLAGDFITTLKSDRYKSNLADAMLSPEATKQLQRMIKLNPGSRQLITQLSTFLTLAGSGVIRDRPLRGTRGLGPKDETLNLGKLQRTQL